MHRHPVEPVPRSTRGRRTGRSPAPRTRRQGAPVRDAGPRSTWMGVSLTPAGYSSHVAGPCNDNRATAIGAAGVNGHGRTVVTHTGPPVGLTGGTPKLATLVPDLSPTPCTPCAPSRWILAAITQPRAPGETRADLGVKGSQVQILSARPNNRPRLAETQTNGGPCLCPDCPNSRPAPKSSAWLFFSLARGGPVSRGRGRRRRRSRAQTCSFRVIAGRSAPVAGTLSRSRVRRSGSRPSWECVGRDPVQPSVLRIWRQRHSTLLPTARCHSASGTPRRSVSPAHATRRRFSGAPPLPDLHVCPMVRANFSSEDCRTLPISWR